MLHLKVQNQERRYKSAVERSGSAPRSVQRRESQARARSHGYSHQSLTMLHDITGHGQHDDVSITPMDDMWEDPVPLMLTSNTRHEVPLMLSQSRHNMMLGLGALGLGRESSVDSPKNSLIR